MATQPAPAFSYALTLDAYQTPLLPGIFCTPIDVERVRASYDSDPDGAVGFAPGPERGELPTWPILVPAAQGFGACLTSDEVLRDTYIAKGFCGLDASFRSRFNDSGICTRQLTVVLETSQEQEGNRGAEHGGQCSGEGRNGNNDGARDARGECQLQCFTFCRPHSSG